MFPSSTGTRHHIWMPTDLARNKDMPAEPECSASLASLRKSNVPDLLLSAVVIHQC